MVKNPPASAGTWVWPLIWKIPLATGQRSPCGPEPPLCNGKSPPEKPMHCNKAQPLLTTRECLCAPTKPKGKQKLIIIKKRIYVTKMPAAVCHRGKKLKIEMLLVEKWLNKHVVPVLWYATCL